MSDEEKLSWLAMFHAAVEALAGPRRTLIHLTRGKLLMKLGWDWERAARAYAADLKSGSKVS